MPELPGIEIKINKLCNKVLLNKKYCEEVSYLKNQLNIDRDQIIASWLYWDTAIKKYSNEVYSSAALRMVMHLHNYLSGSWHVKRQKAVLDYLKIIKTKKICEIGFGVPQQYVREFLKLKNTEIFLGDYENSSFIFAKKVLAYWHKNWKQKINLSIFNMNTDLLPTGYGAYIFQDSIEHAERPFETLVKFVNSVPQNTYFIFSLPIEIKDPIPEHHICWKNEKEVLKWIQKVGLKTIKNKTIKMNREVDIFSLSLHKNFREIVLLAKKD